MRGDTMTVTRRLTSETCCRCGIEFAMPEDFRQELLKDRSRSFYCPSGHGQSYTGKTEAQQLREKLETEQRNAAFWRERKLAEEKARERAERQRDAYKGHATRLKKRVAKGRCPCCSSTFVNLAAHMTKRHPDYAETGVSDG